MAIRRSSYHVIDEQTPEWATFAVVRFAVDNDKNSIDEVVSFVPASPASVTIKLNRSTEYSEANQIEQIFRSIHATEIWMFNKGMIKDVEEVFDDWMEDIAGFLPVVDTIPEIEDDEDDGEEPAPLELVENTPGL